MREIKFRAWDKDSKKMITDIAFLGWNHKGNIEITVSNPDYDPVEMIEMAKAGKQYEPMPCFDYDNIELMQFTGLLDKHNKPIYEGDIVTMNWLTEEYNEVKLNVIESKKEAGGYEKWDEYDFDRENCKEVILKQLTTPVIFENGMFQGIRTVDERILFYHKIEEWEVEVIGNIFENQNLIEI